MQVSASEQQFHHILLCSMNILQKQAFTVVAAYQPKPPHIKNYQVRKTGEKYVHKFVLKGSDRNKSICLIKGLVGLLVVDKSERFVFLLLNNRNRFVPSSRIKTNIYLYHTGNGYPSSQVLTEIQLLYRERLEAKTQPLMVYALCKETDNQNSQVNLNEYDFCTKGRRTIKLAKV